MSFKGFTLSYIKSMRLYYAFITGIAGWIGVSFHNFCMPDYLDYSIKKGKSTIRIHTAKTVRNPSAARKDDRLSE